VERNRSFNIPNGKAAFGTTIPVCGTGMTLGLTNGTNNFGFGTNNQAVLYAPQSSYGTNAGSNTSGSWTTNQTYGITKDSSKSGIVADLSSGAVVIIKY